MSLTDARTTGQLTEAFEDLRKKLRDMGDETERFVRTTYGPPNALTCGEEIRGWAQRLSDLLYEAEGRATVITGAFGEKPASTRWGSR